MDAEPSGPQVPATISRVEPSRGGERFPNVGNFRISGCAGPFAAADLRLLPAVAAAVVEPSLRAVAGRDGDRLGGCELPAAFLAGGGDADVRLPGGGLVVFFFGAIA